MLFISTTMLGYISYKQLKKEMLPNAELPMLFVQVGSAIEVTPEYMEQEAIIPIEGAVAGLGNIESIESNAGRRRGIVFISYEKNTNIKYAYLKLDERIASLRSSLPNQFMVQVIKVDVEMISNNFMNMQVRGEGGEDRIRNFVDQKITPELESIDGVATVNVYGGKEKSVEILLDKAACEAQKISLSRIRNVLSRNMSLRQYGGTINQEGKRHFVYLNAEYKDVLQIENLIVGRGKNPVRLKDIATINYGAKEEETISRVNGKEAVTVAIINDAQANVIDLSHAIRKEIKQLNKKFSPYNIEIVIQDDNAEMMEDNINQIINLALIGGLLAVFILWVFLRNIRLVIVIALAMPISIYTAFNFFYAFDITINSLTLIGIAMAIGMLLDTSVVVLENIYRLRTLGFSPSESVLKGTKEVWRSVVAATLTTITVFLPLIFSSEFLIRLMGKNIGVSIISTLIVSLFVSLLLIPMIVHLVIKRKPKDKKQVYQKVSLDNRGVRFYLFLLKAALRNPALTFLMVFVLLIVVALISTITSTNSLKEVDTGQIDVYVTMNSGSTLESTDATVAKIEKILAEVKEIKDIVAKIEEEDAVIKLILEEDYKEISQRTFGEIQNEVIGLTKNISNADISTTAPPSSNGSRGGGMGGNSSGAAGLQRMLGMGEEEDHILIKGQDFDLMVEFAETIQSYLEEKGNMQHVRLSVKENQPEVHIEFNHRLMSDYDITQNGVVSELASFQPEVESGITFRQGGEEYEIMIKYDDVFDSTIQKDKTLDDLKTLGIPDNIDENMHELQSFSKIFYAKGMREISRTNQEKRIEVNFKYTDEVYDSKELLKISREEIENIIKNAGVPSGVAVELVEKESELQKFKYLILLAFLFIYIILASVFESFVTPFVLLFSIPFAAIGSLFFLSITGNSLFSSNTLMGFLILLGVVVNNGIILLDYVTVLRKNGNRKNRAIIHAGLSRVRPILITTVTTCVAMFPLAMGNAEYVEAIGPPFAITVIGGLSVSTLLTLIYIPMLYNAIEQSLNWIKQLNPILKFSLIGLQFIGVVYIVVFFEMFIWKMVGVVVVVIGVPAIYWFLVNSLRRANTRLIGKDDELNIRIANLVKIYGRDNKMMRDFKAGRKMADNAASIQDSSTAKFEALIWQVPLIGFLVYFTWDYLSSSLWQLVSSIALYYFIIIILKGFIKQYQRRWLAIAISFVRYFSPIIILIAYYATWDNLALTIVIAFFWYLILAIMRSATLLKREGYDINSTAKIFRWFVKLIKIVPGIGRKKEQFKALKGVSLEIQTGMFGLLGPNGAGKSTMIRTICGILEQSYGKIWINGIDTQKKREELQSLIGYLPQEFGMYENMTAKNYLEYQAMLKGLKNPEARNKRIKEVLKSVHMWDSRNKKIGAFSGGMKQRIGIAQVLLHMPRILVVDEPTAGLDPRERIRFRNMLVELSRSRIVIFSTHIIEDISSSCNTMAVINRGRVEFNGTPGEMTQLARGKVWKFIIPASEFKEVTKEMLVVHHMRDGEQIRVRCISREKPFNSAVQEQSLLEDAYLWLLKSNRE